jgi:PAS domain S-box-containing protein
MQIRRAVIEGIAGAVQFGHVYPVFQPIVHLLTMRTVGFEVLARWTDAELGEVPPVEFIPAAHDKALLPVLTCKLIRAACLAAHGWQEDCYLAFNVPPSLLQDPQAMGLMVDAISETGFPFSRVRIEMTEAELIEDETAVRQGVQSLKALGMKVVLDDFGTGFSSLVRLNEFDFDEIKIDGGFVRRLEVDADSRKIVAAVVGLGHSLEMPVVAEAVETSEQAAFLRRLGCDFVQGWWLGRPVSAEAVPTLLGNRITAGRAQQGLQLSPFHRQYHLQALYESAPVGLCFIDTGKRHQSANQAFCRMIGKESEQVVGKAIQEVYTPEIAVLVERMVEGSLDGSSGESIEFKFPDRPEVWLVYHHPVQDESGCLLGLSVVSVDITERKQAERALRDSEQNYRHCVELSPTVMWIAEPSGALSYISPMVDEPPLRTLQERIEAWYARMDVEDRLRVRAEWLAWLPGRGVFETRFRIQWPQGAWRWVRSRARPHLADGELVRWYGTFSDITREVELQARVRELEARLAHNSEQ